MKFEGKRVRVFRTHEQLAEDFQYEGEFVGFHAGKCTVVCDDGKVTAPYVTLCRISINKETNDKEENRP